MKKLKINLTILLFAMSAAVFAQTKETSHGQRVYKQKTTRNTTRLTYKDSIKTKENAPILNDNGTTSTTGTIDGRSSTGRPGADTLVSYSVKRKKTTIRTDNNGAPQSVKTKKKQP